MAKDTTKKDFQILENVYRDFISSDELSSKYISRRSSLREADQEDFRNLMDVLFPRIAGSFMNGPQMWQKFKSLAGGDDGFKEILSRKLRFYYVDGKSNSEVPIEKEIRDWYTGTDATLGPRPSAYNYQAGEEIKTDKTFRDFIKACTSEAELQKDAEDDTLLGTSLTMIAIDTPAIDIKMRHSDTTAVFLNYLPALAISQMVPYLDVRFVLERKADGPDNERSLTGMSQLKFLLGSQEIGNGPATTANQLMYDGSILQRRKTYEVLQETAASGNTALAGLKSAGGPKKKPQPKPPTQSSEPPPQQKVFKTDGADRMTVGMEMFTMPQTLINMDYDSTTTPRYNPVLNQTIPFGVISSVNIQVTPGPGVFSYKSASLNLKIFDRSRLVEIADFLNPNLYQAATIWLMYGWRSPTQSFGSESENEYASLVNNNMMKREAYGIRNTSMTIDNSGIVNITLSLFTKLGAELSEINPTTASMNFISRHNQIRSRFNRLKELAEKLGLSNLSSGAKNIRGSQLIASATTGIPPNIEKSEMDEQIKTIEEAYKSNTNPDAKEFIEELKRSFSIIGGKNSKKTQIQVDSEVEAAKVTASRFESLKTSKDNKGAKFDFFATFDKKFDLDQPKPLTHPILKAKASFKKKQTPTARVEGASADATQFGEFGDITFAKLFTSYFCSAIKPLGKDDASPVDEYQVIFYNINSYAGNIANTNIADFPIDFDKLLIKYSEKVVELNGENLTLISFLELVRECQFNDIRHKIYGFSDLYDGEGNMLKDSDTEYLRRMTENANIGSAFVMPAIDIYIETGYLKSDGTEATGLHDLLTSFEMSAAETASGNRSSIASDTTKILRIHIYDQAATPYKAAMDIFKLDDGKFVEVDSEWKKAYEKDMLEKLPKPQPTKGNQTEASNTSANVTINNDSSITITTDAVPNGKPFSPANIKYNKLNFGSNIGKSDPKAKFENVKKSISKYVPTISIGTTGTAVKNISYSTNQDALLGTIMMLRDGASAVNPSTPNGSGVGDIPLRVIPGALTLTTLGCPTLEYMQQFFIDLGTGTTIDSLYNITSLTHTISPGTFTTEAKFTFADAYGQLESAQTITTGMQGMANTIAQEAKTSIDLEARNAPAKKK